jgi:hypothetical protein
MAPMSVAVQTGLLTDKLSMIGAYGWEATASATWSTKSRRALSRTLNWLISQACPSLVVGEHGGASGLLCARPKFGSTCRVARCMRGSEHVSDFLNRCRCQIPRRSEML